MKKEQIHLEQTAYHEAGHIVVQLVQGYTIDRASIEAEEDSLGRVHKALPLLYEDFSTSGKREKRKTVEAFIRASYAGYEAECLYDPAAEEFRSEGDFSQAWSLPRDHGIAPRGCAYIGDDVYERYLQRLRKEAKRLVRKHWNLIVAIAQELLETKEVSDEQARKVLIPAGWSE